MTTMYCQECRTPLRLDGSLQELNPAAFKLLTDTTGTALPQRLPSHRTAEQKVRLEEFNRISQNAQSPAFSRTVPSNAPSSQNPAMSFVMLSDSQMHDTGGNKSDSRLSRDTTQSPSRSRRQPATKKAQKEKDSQLPLSQQSEKADRLFEILSARSDIDHPICIECTELLVDSLQKRLNTATRERDSYVEFLRRAHADIPTSEDLATARSKLEHLKLKEAVAFRELEALETEKVGLDRELEALEAESLALGEEEERFWAGRNEFSMELGQHQKEREALTTKLEHDTKQLERLQRANVYNDTFTIGHDNHFATINGLRLGRLPDRPVDWAEINAAWGHTCLLLQTVAEKLRFKFEGYELLPMGSVSRVRQYTPTTAPEPTRNPSHNQNSGTGGGRGDVDSPTNSRMTLRDGHASTSVNAPTQQYKTKTLDLFHSGGSASDAFPLLPIPGLTNRRFDAGMVAFLTCLAQLADHAATHTFPSANTITSPPSSTPTKPPFSSPNSNQTPPSSSSTKQGETTCAPIPYPISKDRINNYSIKLGAGLGSIVGGGRGGGGDEEWTRACKALLTNCKFLLASASNVGDGGAIRRREDV